MHSLYGGINMYVGHSLFCLDILMPLFIEEVHYMVIFLLFHTRNGEDNVGQRR